MLDYRNVNPIYKFTYQCEHYYEIIIDNYHSVYFALTAGSSLKLRSVDMIEFNNAYKNSAYWTEAKFFEEVLQK